MKREEIQAYKCKINGVTFKKENLADITEYIIETLEYKFNIEFNDSALTSLLANSLHTEYLKSDGISYNEIEHELYRHIDNCSNINDLKLNVYDNSDYYKEFNNTFQKYYSREASS